MAPDYDATGMRLRERSTTFARSAEGTVQQVGSELLAGTRNDEIARFMDRARAVNGTDSLEGWNWGDIGRYSEDAPQYSARAVVARFTDGDGREEEVWMPQLENEKTGNSMILTPDGTRVRLIRSSTSNSPVSSGLELFSEPDAEGKRHPIFAGVEQMSEDRLYAKVDGGRSLGEYVMPNGRRLTLEDVFVARTDTAKVVEMKAGLKATLDSWQKLVGWKDVPDKS
jgi:hypothetical protein